MLGVRHLRYISISPPKHRMFWGLMRGGGGGEFGKFGVECCFEGDGDVIGLVGGGKGSKWKPGVNATSVVQSGEI